MISAVSIILALSAVLISCLVAYCIKKLSKEAEYYDKSNDRRKSEKKPTEFLDTKKIDEACEICFGAFEEGDVSVCTCGKKFHRECVEITEECPYCREKPGRMTVRGIYRPVCPSCGKTLSGCICECGVVLPHKDMRFECECGETLLTKNSECPKCGSKYAFFIGRSRKPI